MYVNKCVKCGREFETKNPKRVICPDCLYPDKNMMIKPSADAPAEIQPSQAPESPEVSRPLNGYSTENQPQFYNSYSAGEGRPQRPQRPYNQGYNQNRDNYRNNQGGYNRGYNQNRSPQGGYRNNQGGYNRNYNQNRPQQGGYRRDNRGYNQNRPQGGGFRRDNRGFQKRPQMRNKAPKQLLVSKEQLEQIELLYKMMLPLPNPDAHEVIGEKIGLEPRKVFFGINLVRQKLMLPKIPFPKRKLAISPDQLFAIKNLYEPLLPLPPIGCHKIIAAQLKMDEWRVHVGIGLIRSQMGLQRWNQDRTDIPEEFKKKMEEHQAAAEAKAAAKAAEKAAKKAAEEQSAAAESEVEQVQPAENTEIPEEEKPKRGRKPKKVEVEETAES